MKKQIVLAFDIERSGGTAEYETIGIGASVVSSELEELDSIFLPNYYPGITKFEPKCWNEFWCKFPEKLEILKYDGPLSSQEREKEVITKFQEFRKKWEIYAKENGFSYYIVSDNNIYDGGFINDMIFTPSEFSNATKVT